MGQLEDFYARSSVLFTAELRLNDTPVDVRLDTVELVLSPEQSRYSATARVVFAGNVAGGDTGLAAFELTPDDTDLSPGIYRYQIVWTRQNGQQHIPDEGKVQVFGRL